MSTPELVAKYLRLDRAIGTVCEFIGVDKNSLSIEDQKALDAAVTEMDAASDDLQKEIYATSGV